MTIKYRTLRENLILIKMVVSVIPWFVFKSSIGLWGESEVLFVLLMRILLSVTYFKYRTLRENLSSKIWLPLLLHPFLKTSIGLWGESDSIRWLWFFTCVVPLYCEYRTLWENLECLILTSEIMYVLAMLLKYRTLRRIWCLIKVHICCLDSILLEQV
jgi:hypothetical protein